MYRDGVRDGRVSWRAIGSADRHLDIGNTDRDDLRIDDQRPVRYDGGVDHRGRAERTGRQ